MNIDEPTGSHREVVRVAWPLVVSMLSYTFMGLADTMMVARLGTTEVAAVGIASTTFFGVACLGMGLLSGVRVLVAQCEGAQTPQRGVRIAWLGVLVGFCLSVLMMGVLPWSEPLLNLIADGGETGHLAHTYFDVRLWGTFGALVGIAALAWYEGRGETRLPMHVRVWTNVLNIGLDYVLIFGWGPIEAMGVRGAAWATVAAMSLQGLIGLGMLVHRAGLPDRSILEEFVPLMRIGGPLGVQWALEVQSWTVFGAVVARMGEAQLAAHAIVVRIVSTSFLPGHAIGDAAGILVGQAVGARDQEGARRAARSALHVGLLVMGSLGVVFVAAPSWLLLPFRPEPRVAEVAVQLLAIAAAFQLADAAVMTRSGSLSGLGDTRYVMVAGVASAWFVQLPLGWALCVGHDMAAPGAWLGLLIHFVGLGALLSARWSWQMRRDALPPLVEATSSA